MPTSGLRTRRRHTASADRFIRLHPQHPNVDYAYSPERFGLLCSEQGIFSLSSFLPTDETKRDPGSARNSFVTFNELLNRFPKAPTRPMPASGWSTCATSLPDMKFMLPTTIFCGVPIWLPPTADAMWLKISRKRPQCRTDWRSWRRLIISCRCRSGSRCGGTPGSQLPPAPRSGYQRSVPVPGRPPFYGADLAE